MGEDLSDNYCQVLILIADLPSKQLEEVGWYYSAKLKQINPSYALIRILSTVVMIGLNSTSQQRELYIEIIQKYLYEALKGLKETLGIEVNLNPQQFSQQHVASFCRQLLMSIAMVNNLMPNRDLVLALSIALARDLSEPRMLPPDLARELVRDLDRAITITKALALARDRDLALARDRDLALARDRDLALARDRDLALARGLAQDLVKTRESLQVRTRGASRAQARALARALALARAQTQNRAQFRGYSGDVSRAQVLARVRIEISNVDLQKILEIIESILTSNSNTWLEDLLSLAQNVAYGIHAAQIAAEGIEALQTINA
jgi:hypothetical protein